MLLHEAGALDEHAAGAAGRVEDAPVEGLDDADDELDDGGGSEELAALLTLAHRELAEEVLVDLAEGVALDVHRDRVHDLQQLGQGGALKPVVGLGQDVLEVRVLGLDGPHGVVDRLADVRRLRGAAISVEKRASAGR